MSSRREPSYEDLVALVAVQARQIARLEDEVAWLRRQRGQDSSNSSRPPSTDSPFVKPAPASLRAKSGRRPGGQGGHPGRALRQVADPGRVVVHEPQRCGGCGAGLVGARRVRVACRRVFDIPPIAVRVVEHRVVTRRCRCGWLCAGRAPAGVAAPVCDGPNIAAAGVYLYAGQFLSRQGTGQALSQLLGTPVSAGTVSAWAGRAAGRVAGSGVVAAIAGRIAAAPVAHFDETGLRVAGRLAWVHSASTGTDSLITVHPKRGIAAMDAAGVLPAFTGVAVHDAWAPYDTYTAAAHALCNAHLLRELVAVIDNSPEDGWCWAEQARQALLELKSMSQAAHDGHSSIKPDHRRRLVHRLRSAAVIGAQATATGPVAAKHRALARRIRDRLEDYLRFLDDRLVPFDNNHAEREIRMIKVRQKVSGALRTLHGAEAFCSIRSYLATAVKHGLRFIDVLTMLAEGRAWLPTPA